MKRVLLAMTAIVSIAAQANATGSPTTAPANQAGAIAGAASNATSNSVARSGSYSRSSGVGVGGAGGSATGGTGLGGSGGSGGAGGMGGGGGSVTNNVGGPGTYRQEYGGGYTVRNNPDLAALVASTANVCAKPAGGTTSFLGVGLGALFTPESDRCNRRLDAAALAGLGRPDAALLLLQETEEVRSVMAKADASRPAPLPVKPAYCTEKPRETAAERYMRLANC